MVKETVILVYFYLLIMIKKARLNKCLFYLSESDIGRFPSVNCIEFNTWSDMNISYILNLNLNDSQLFSLSFKPRAKLIMTNNHKINELADELILLKQKFPTLIQVNLELKNINGFELKSNLGFYYKFPDIVNLIFDKSVLKFHLNGEILTNQNCQSFQFYLDEKQRRNIRYANMSFCV